MSEAGDVLRRAKARIGTPERWIKGTTATLHGRPGVSTVHNPDACLCVNGALLSCSDPDVGPPPAGTSICLSLAARGRGFETASQFNDAPGTTHGDVMALFDEAAAMADAMPG